MQGLMAEIDPSLKAFKGANRRSAWVASGDVELDELRF
jgi:hypothetical protein